MDRIMDCWQALAGSGRICAVNLEYEEISCPVCGLTKGHQVDRFFVYSNQPLAKKGRPYAYFEIESISGNFVKYVSCETEDFAEGLNIPLGTVINYQPAVEESVYDAMHTAAEFARLYEEIRKFAFCIDITPEQRQILGQYNDLQNKRIGTDVLPFYEALSPEFFKWMQEIS